MPSTLRAIVTLPFTSGLPEDIVTNTFHFTTVSDPPAAGELTDIMDAVEAFYNVSSGVAGDQLAGFTSNLISRVASACSIEIFDLGDPEPRVSIALRLFTLGAADSATSMPTEVALCCSFQAPLQSGIPQARRRGRVYTGPFIQSTTLASTGRPSAALIASVAAAGNALLDTLQDVGGPRWVVYSRVDDAAYEITNGWVDDEFDTIRARGRRSTTRTEFFD